MRRVTLLVACALALSGLRCGTVLWDPDTSFTGRTLDRGQTEIAFNSMISSILGALGVGYGLNQGLEVRGLVGNFGSVVSGVGSYLPQSGIIGGASVGIRKQLWDAGENCMSVSGELSGFDYTWKFNSEDIYGGWIGAGAALSQFPLPWLGLHLPVKLLVL